jgi:hypothetical protein
MNVIVIVTALLMLIGVGPAAAQSTKSNDSRGGGLGGVLDTLGGILNAGGGKVHGSVVAAHDTSLVLRTDDNRTLRLDTGSIDPKVREQLVPGQMVTVTAKGAGADVLTASDVQVEQGKTAAQKFQEVPGTVQGRSDNRVLFRTRDGLTIPVDTSQIRGLPYFAANTPATLIYQQGPNQEIQAVWIEPAESSPSASPTTDRATTSAPAASNAPGGQTLQGMVESLGINDLTLQTADGRHVTVATGTVDRNSLASVRPGDSVTVTGTPGSDPARFTATSIAPMK